MLDATTKRKIDSARQILVGKVPDPKAQVEQITTALVYKFMDDMDKEAVELGGKAKFFTDDLKDFAWSKLLDTRYSGQERMDLYVRAISAFAKAKQLPQLFRDIFKDAFLPYRDPETLSLFLKEIDNFTYDHSEDLGNAFEYLLSVLGSQGDAGQFRTPRHIIDFIVAVVDPKKSETVLDPACGTAGFLISAYKHILKQNSSNFKNSSGGSLIKKGASAEETVIESSGKFSGDLLTPTEKGKVMDHIVGYDISPDMVKLSLVNMYLHGFPTPNIFEYDTLTSEKRWNENFDVIMANPPFMTPKGGIRPHKRFILQSSRAEALFVDYILEHINTNGRGAVIVPDGIVSNTNASFYTKLRKTLVDNNYLWAVVSMPSGIFKPYAGAKTSILFLDSQLAKKRNGILFTKLEHDGFDLGEQRKSIEKNDIPEIVNALISYKEHGRVDYKNAHIVEKKQIADTQHYLLAGDFYLHQALKKSSKYEYIPLGTIVTEVSTKVKDAKVPIEKIEPLSITMKDGLVLQSEKFNKRIANKDVSGYKLVKKGQLVVGFPIDEGVLDILKIADYGAVSPAYSVWDVNNHKALDLDYFNLVIKSDRALDVYRKLMNRTANRRRSIKKDVFLKIEIPLPPLNEQKKVVGLLNKAANLRNEADKLVENSKIMINKIWE